MATYSALAVKTCLNLKVLALFWRNQNNRIPKLGYRRSVFNLPKKKKEMMMNSVGAIIFRHGTSIVPQSHSMRPRVSKEFGSNQV